MTRRRRVLLVLAFMAMAVAGSMAILLTAPRNRINVDTIQLVKAGMTKAEIEDIFGVPPGDYSGRQLWENSTSLSIKGEQTAGWANAEFIVIISFDSSGKSQEVLLVSNSMPETLLTKFRRWLRL